MPGQQTVIMQMKLHAERMATGMPAKKLASYTMPGYNYSAPNAMQVPNHSNRQYQDAGAVQTRGFMGQSHKK